MEKDIPQENTPRTPGSNGYLHLLIIGAPSKFISQETENRIALLNYVIPHPESGFPDEAHGMTIAELLGDNQED